MRKKLNRKRFYHRKLLYIGLNCKIKAYGKEAEKDIEKNQWNSIINTPGFERVKVMKVKQSMPCFIIITISSLLCFILKKNGLVVSIFSLIYITTIYIKSSNNTQKFLYYICIFFAIVKLGHQINYYIAFSMYILIYLYNNLNIIKNLIIQKKQRIYIIKNLNKYEGFLIVFSLYAVVSLIWSINKLDAMEYLSRYIIGITLLIMVVKENKSKEDLKGTFKLLIYILLGILCIGTAQIAGMDFGLPNHNKESNYIIHDLLSNKIDRVPVTFFHNSNNNAYFLVIGLAVVLYAIFSSKSKKNIILNYIMLIFISINLIFSRSRMGLYGGCIYIVLVIGLGILNFKKDNKFAYKSIRHGLASLVIILGTLFSCSLNSKLDFYTCKFIKVPSVNVGETLDVGINRLSLAIKKIINVETKIYNEIILGDLWKTQNDNIPKKNVIGKSGADNTRITLIYDVVVKGLIEQKNFFGVGVGNSSNFIKGVGNTNKILNIHSMWFEILCDFGLGIFIYLIYIYLSLIYDIIRQKNKNEFYVFASGMCCVNIILVFGPSSVIHFAPFWILMGTIYAIKVCGEKEKKYKG